MLPETLTHLREHDFMRGDQVDRVKLADRCRELLLAKPVRSAEQEEIQDKALIVPELRYTLLGEAADQEVERELDLLINPLVGANGIVQKGLENGYVLCAAQVSRKLGNGDGTITIKRRGRFVSDNPDAIEEHFWTPALARLSSAMTMVADRLDLGVRRQPALTARKPAQIAKAHERIRLELPMGGPESS
jgi:hypothetical protein